MMKIRVSIDVMAVHQWKGASGDREYLGYPHAHKFKITAWAKVSHSDRNIEFHDMRDDLYRVVMGMVSVARIGKTSMDNFGGASCEDIGNHVLKEMPYVDMVRVMEDEDCGAEVDRR